jgi:hypothetical protein
MLNWRQREHGRRDVRFRHGRPRSPTKCLWASRVSQRKSLAKWRYFAVRQLFSEPLYARDHVVALAPFPALPSLRLPSRVSVTSALAARPITALHFMGRLRLIDSRDDDFAVFARGTIIGAEIVARFLWFDPGEDQRPAALGTRRPKIIDKLERRRVCHGGDNPAPLSV